MSLFRAVNGIQRDNVIYAKLHEVSVGTYCDQTKQVKSSDVYTLTSSSAIG
ncbi:hypothetical protein [Paenibacillus sp. FSL A5-0031]|uniref:hypothetical protein n=1 Tax=Paenibacillus sp. FSL A5-0031 TaxID=1920420 RepID=UPI0015C3C1D1|nr:hypothetical protein [Paenibacillus sp. FSL A5-0031]